MHVTREIQGHLWRLVIQYLLWLKIWSPRHLFGTDMQRRRRLWLPGQAWKRTGKQYRTSSTRTITGHWTPKIHKINFWNYQYLRRWDLWYKTQPSKVLCDVLTDMLETLPIVTRPILTHKWQPLLYLTSWMKLQYNATMEKLWSRVGCPSIWYSTLHRPVVETIYVRSNARSPDSDVWPPKGSPGHRELRQRDVGHFCLPVTLKYLQGDNGGIYNVHIYLTFLCNFLIDLLLQLIMTYACHKCNR